MIEAIVTQFNDTYKVPVKEVPELPNEAEGLLLHSLILEELVELNDALDDGDVVGVADAIADLIYVIAQQGVKLGFPIDEMIQEVHSSNMSKLGEDGQPLFREDGKVLKGPNFREPDLVQVLRRHGAGV